MEIGNVSFTDKYIQTQSLVSHNNLVCRPESWTVKKPFQLHQEPLTCIIIRLIILLFNPGVVVDTDIFCRTSHP
jgi:hypothetical protein